MDLDYSRISSWRYRWGSGSVRGSRFIATIGRTRAAWVEGFIIGAVAGFILGKLI